MDEILEKVADLVATLVIAVRDSEEKGTRFGDMVPAAELIRRSADGIHSSLYCFYLYFFDLLPLQCHFSMIFTRNGGSSSTRQ